MYKVELREGRKVNLFLVGAAQDFLVKSVGGTGAVRDCYRTAFYVGGDQTSARVLLDVKGRVDDGQLGRGLAMLRSKATPTAQVVRVPLASNGTLARLLADVTAEVEERHSTTSTTSTSSTGGCTGPTSSTRAAEAGSNGAQIPDATQLVEHFPIGRRPLKPDEAGLVAQFYDNGQGLSLNRLCDVVYGQKDKATLEWIKQALAADEPSS